MKELIIGVDDMTNLFNCKKLVAHDGAVFERLTDHPDKERYRIILSFDDYDYIEDQELCDLLDTLPVLFK